jgi:hypothetical protein
LLSRWRETDDVETALKYCSGEVGLVTSERVQWRVLGFKGLSIALMTCYSPGKESNRRLLPRLRSLDDGGLRCLFVGTWLESLQGLGQKDINHSVRTREMSCMSHVGPRNSIRFQRG